MSFEKIYKLIEDVKSFVEGGSSAGAAASAAKAPVVKLPERKKYYITTAINYTNGRPHIGHAYEGVTSDALARWHTMFGREVFFLTGSDEHGQKIANAAEAKGMTPKQLCDDNVKAFKALNKRLKISNHRYIRTTDPDHEDLARLIFKKAHAAGDIYLTDYEGWYNPREEAYVKESDAKKTDYKDPVSGRPYDKHKEPAYFFKMSRYHKWLVEHIKSHPEFIQPDAKRNNILSRLTNDDLTDLCVSRSTFDWGVPLPHIDEESKKHVMYVWFDALSNYLSGIGYPNGKDAKFWPCDVHIIGQDITWFHTVIWPIMLKSAGIPLPRQVFSHGFVNDMKGQKMSKSIGNVIDPNDMIDKYNSDALRFHLLHGCTYGADMKFIEAHLVEEHDSILADSFGNCFRRAQTLCTKLCKSVVPDVPSETEILKQHGFDFETLQTQLDTHYRRFEIKEAMGLTLEACRAVDGYLQARQPWHMKNHADKIPVIKTTLEAMYICAHLLIPAIPDACEVALAQFGQGKSVLQKLRPTLDNLQPGSKIAEPTKENILFPKIAEDKKKANAKKKAPKPKKKNVVTPAIARFTFTCGKIVSVEDHPSADGCFVEQIDVGEAEPRTIVSGLRKYMKKSDLQDRLVVVVSNLAPAPLKGVTSNGMVLVASAEGSDKKEFLTPPKGAKPGDRCVAEGFESYPKSDEIMDIKKKRRKQWKQVHKGLLTDDKCRACFSGKPLTVAGKGPVTVSSLANSQIS